MSDAKGELLSSAKQLGLSLFRSRETRQEASINKDNETISRRAPLEFSLHSKVDRAAALGRCCGDGKDCTSKGDVAQ